MHSLFLLDSRVAAILKPSDYRDLAMPPEIKTAESDTRKTDPWNQVELKVNNQVVQSGTTIELIHRKENEVTVEVPEGFANRMYLGLADNEHGTVVSVPPFQSPVAPVDRKFRWMITPGADQPGVFTLVFYTQDLPVPWAFVVVVKPEQIDAYFLGALVTGPIPIRRGGGRLTLKLNSGNSADQSVRLEWLLPHKDARFNPELPSSLPINTEHGAAWYVGLPFDGLVWGSFSVTATVDGLVSRKIFFMIEDET